MDSWTLCEDTLVAVDDLLCNRVRQCTLCGARAERDTLWPVPVAGRRVGIACGLCAACLKANEADRLDALLRQRYGHAKGPEHGGVSILSIVSASRARGTA